MIDEVIGENADIVVVGQLTSSRWRLLQRIRSRPDIETALRDHLDCTVITVVT